MGRISVGDGFRFGCGFFLAGLVAYIVVVLIIMVIALLFGTTLSELLKGLESSGFPLLLPALV